ncbi:MAG TPA: hypothetical protein VMT01_03380 [Candidatus Acidoferrum sp.]|jgi:hypothetical protein|nr:hypothetical protein [Candidatus Acidoferrum sp.]
MKKQLIFVTVLFAILALTLTVHGVAPRTVGVHVGEWAHYVFTFQGNSTTPGPDPNMTSGLFTIMSISGTNVTLQMHSYYPNGSDFIEYHWIDVDTGQNDGNATGMLIAANLNQGDPVYTTSVAPFMDGTLNDTLTRNYLGQPAQVNHFGLNYTTPPNPIYNLTSTMDWYWYRATGIPAEITMNYTDQVSMGNSTWFNWSLLIDNIVPEFPALLVTPVFMITTLVAVAVCKMKKKR